MPITTKAVAAFLALSLSGGAALANEARLDVSASPDGSAVDLLTVTQTPASESRITQAPQASGNAALADFDYYADGRTDTFLGNNLVYPANGRGQITGSYQSVSISQGPGANKLAVNIAGKPESTTATVALSYNGTGNEHSLRAGAGEGANSTFLNAAIAADVSGDGNDIRDNIRGGGAGALSYDLDIVGNDNDVRVNYGNLRSALAYKADITGSNNQLTISGGTEQAMNKSLTFTVSGSQNDITYRGQGTLNASLTGTFTGDNIDADLLQQNGDNQTAVLMVTNDPGASALDFDLSQQGFNQSVDATVTHLAGGAVAGSFSITQDATSFGAVYNGTTVISGGGTGTVSQ